MKAELKTIGNGMGVGLLAAMLLMAAPVSAQEDQVPTPPPVEQAQDAVLQVETISTVVPTAAPGAGTVDNTALLAIASAKQQVRDASVTPEEVTTLFFTAWQHALLQEAKIGFETALPQPGAVASSSSGAPRDPGIREIALGGIAFYNPDRWTVWLNGVRITPEAIPEAVMDIKVSRAYIDLKWFDGYTNKIYPIRLRPQERFNLDSRIFLPGTGAM